MAEITLKATTGRELGSGPSKRIRVEGKVPGVVYGLDADPIPVTGTGLVSWHWLSTPLKMSPSMASAPPSDPTLTQSQLSAQGWSGR